MDRVKVNYICGKCAEKNRGKWPEGHVATFHTGDCDWCGLSKGLAHVSDWNWPVDHPLHKQQYNREF